MHILLTDILRCPRCGPGFGLVLLADRVEERRVAEGRLGCANCREAYPVRGGEADLRVPGGERIPQGRAPAGGSEAAVRLAALLGLTEAWGSVLLVDAGADLAGALSTLVPGIEVIVAAGEPAGEAREGTSRVVADVPLPFAARSLRGVSLDGGGGAGLLDEGARVLAPGGRLVLEDAPRDASDRLTGAGLRVLLDQEGVVVAESSVGR
ncbi:MAG TPA: Trm112 family protein [Longimicrobiaceae bacterium]|nr:Trm112 family protein [Longimicrobiaceae bacterium]